MNLTPGPFPFRRGGCPPVTRGRVTAGLPAFSDENCPPDSYPGAPNPSKLGAYWQVKQTCGPKVSKGRSESPLVAPAGAKAISLPSPPPEGGTSPRGRGRRVMSGGIAVHAIRRKPHPSAQVLTPSPEGEGFGSSSHFLPSPLGEGGPLAVDEVVSGDACGGEAFRGATSLPATSPFRRRRETEGFQRANGKPPPSLP